jgi:hypothetical protein
MLGASYVEKALEVAIMSRLTPLTPNERKGIFSYESRGPLSDLSSRIKLAYALDVVGPKTRDDLEHVRAVRNSFAHALRPVGFELKEVSDVCNLLNLHYELTLMTRWAMGDSPRARYINTTITIATRLKHKIAAGEVTTPTMHQGRAFDRRLLP